MARVHSVSDEVFSAHAEVVPRRPKTRRSHPSILRARGGSSPAEVILIPGIEYSPRTRR